MTDLAYLILIVALFLAMAPLVRGLDRL